MPRGLTPSGFKLIKTPRLFTRSAAIGSTVNAPRGLTARGWKFIPNPAAPVLLASTLEMQLMLGERAGAAADVAKEIAPVGEGIGGHYKDMIDGTSGIANGRALGRVNAWKFTSGWLEFGTSDTPVFAVLRRAVEAIGLRMTGGRV